MRSPIPGRITLIVLAALASARAEPPKVVSATPDDGQTNLDPAKTRELCVVFDQPMDPGSRSIVGGGETFPLLIGKIRWVDLKTFVFPMKLEPNHEYWLSINNENFANFQNTKGESAIPHPISFRTGAATQPLSQKDDNQRAIEILRQAIDEDYSYRDRLKVDWPARFKEFAPRLLAADSPKAFADEAAKLLSAAKDVHLTLRVGEEFVGTHQTGTTRNFNLALLAKVVPNWTEVEGGIATGHYDDGVGYVLIPAWSAEQQQGMESAYAALADAKGLIIDVRPNGGGDEIMARQFAGCFVDAPKVYSRNTYRHDGQVSKTLDRAVAPDKARPAYRGPVVVLMGPKNVSSCESFLLMMRQVPGCKLVGDRSYGSSGNPKPVELGNGVKAFIPSWVDMLPDGTGLEGKGVAPDVQVKATPDDLTDRDPVLEAGLKILREPAVDRAPK